MWSVSGASTVSFLKLNVQENRGNSKCTHPSSSTTVNSRHVSENLILILNISCKIKSLDTFQTFSTSISHLHLPFSPLLSFTPASLIRATLCYLMRPEHSYGVVVLFVWNFKENFKVNFLFHMVLLIYLGHAIYLFISCAQPT